MDIDTRLITEPGQRINILIMKNNLLLTIIILLTSLGTTHAFHQQNNPPTSIENPKDSIRIAELDRYYAELSRTVREGDYEGYGTGYHEDAIVIFASGKNKVSVPIVKALKGWKSGFDATKEGEADSFVEFRFSQRIGNETTAHDTGIFYYSTCDKGEDPAVYITHFEMLLVKRDGVWIAMMEYQKADATLEEWEALK